MRYKLLLLVLTITVAMGAGPFRGPFRGGYSRVNQLYPSVKGPGPGVIAPGNGAGAGMANGMSPNGPRAGGAGYGGMFGQQGDAQLHFLGTPGMNICWDVTALGSFDSEPLVCPGFQNFEMGKSYRLKISNIKNRPELILYPTLEVNSMTPRTSAYLEHNAIPITFTENDFDQVQAGHFITKVVFLPAPEFQNLAISGGVDTIVNTQLPAGTDPVVEAQNRGAVLAVIRMGNRDLSIHNPMGMNEFSLQADDSSRIPQIPISGVNIPAYGTPNSTTPYGVAGPPILPPAGTGLVTPRLIEPVNPMPSTDVPHVAPNWSGNQF